MRAVEAESAKKDRRRAQERATDQQAVQRAAAETEQVRADAAAEVAAAQERARAAEARAEQRVTERAHCGTVRGDLSLADRVFTCDCGHVADRDLNAAVNLACWATPTTMIHR